MVILHHVDPRMIPGLPEFSGASGFLFWRLRSFGASGVDLFFVLSGYLVGGLLLQELEKYGRINIPRFILRRGLKIWPSYYFVLLVLAITGVTGCIDGSSAASMARSLAIHGFFLQNYLDREHLTPTWTLAVEEHFYVTLPFLMAVIHRRRRLSLLWAVSLGCLALCLVLRLLHLRFTPQSTDSILTHNRFDTLLLGVFLAWAWREYPDRIRALTRNRWRAFAAVAVLISPAFFLTRQSPVLLSAGYTSLALGYGLLLLTVVAHGFGKLETCLPGRILRRIGLWSYNIYLWHYFLPLLLAPVYNPAQLWLSRLVPSPIVTLILQVSLFAGLAVLAGWFFTRFLEEPCLRWRNRRIPSRTVPVQIN